MDHPHQRRPVRFLKPSQDDDRFGNLPKRQCFEDRASNLEDNLDPGSSTGGSVSSLVYNNPYASLSVQHQRTRLPIFKNRNHVLYLLEKYQTLIIVGETGCGKSTQVPQYLAETGWASPKDDRIIGITQPRRVAVVTLANRVAEEKSCIVGQEVGYVVRFDDCTDSDRTKIKYLTDGILVREILSDPLLTKYSVIMVDEAHERSINTDIILGLLRKIISKRPDLRIIVSSATLDAEVFRDFFNLNTTKNKEKDTASIISVEGRMYPVHIFYSKTPVPDYIKASVNTVLRIHKNEPPGDILVFLTGMDEADGACRMLREESKALKNDFDKLWILPMYGALPAREQLKVFDSSPAGMRKVVFATNIAEASITIPGIAYVVDCGFVKLRALNPKNGLESLMTVPISQASAEQRAGRAGRIRSGKVYRLYPESEYEKLKSATPPEIQRSHMSSVILQLKALGVDNVLRFHYLSPPPAYAMIGGLELLFALGALDREGHLTQPLGFQMAEFPLPPMHAKVLLSSGEMGCSEEMLSIIAMLQIQDVFVMPSGQKHKAEVVKRKFAVHEGDHLTLLNVYTAFEKNGRDKRWCGQQFLNYRGLNRAGEIRNQLKKYLEKYSIPIVSCRDNQIMSPEIIRKCLVMGFFSNAARLHYTGEYRTIKEDYPMKVHKGSVIMYRKDYPKWVIFNEVLSDSLRDITVIEPEWLYELAPHYYEFGTTAELSEKRAKMEN